MIRIVVVILILSWYAPSIAQEIVLNKEASLEQVYMDFIDSESLLPMNDLGVEFGYVLYQAEITTDVERTELQLENVRDYAVVYVDGKLQGTLADNNKKIVLETVPGTHQIQLYVENIGRVTYGPEILDNSKGLFGNITVGGKSQENWTMIPLNIRNLPVRGLTFEARSANHTPCFYKGTFVVQSPQDIYLDISGWGMGEVWMNNRYLGSYWEQEKQQSIQIRSDDLLKGRNEIVVFELKNNRQNTMRLSETPVFR